MKIKVWLEIGKKVYENNGNWEITKIEECGWNEKKKWFVRLRDELTVKKLLCLISVTLHSLFQFACRCFFRIHHPSQYFFILAQATNSWKKFYLACLDFILFPDVNQIHGFFFTFSGLTFEKSLDVTFLKWNKYKYYLGNSTFKKYDVLNF